MGIGFLFLKMTKEVFAGENRNPWRDVQEEIELSEF